MGRTRRYESPCIESVITSWETAIYARLSVENSGKNDDGESIPSVKSLKTYPEKIVGTQQA